MIYFIYFPAGAGKYREDRPRAENNGKPLETQRFWIISQSPGKGAGKRREKPYPGKINKINQKIMIYSLYVSVLVSLFIYLFYSFNFLILDCVGPETLNNISP